MTGGPAWVRQRPFVYQDEIAPSIFGQMIDDRIIELIAVGASVSANCRPCIKYHVAKAREMKIPEDEIKQAVDAGTMVRKGAAQQMDRLISETL